MRLYRIDWPDTDHEWQRHWSGSVNEWRGEVRAIVNDGVKRADVNVTVVNVPTNKKELLAWLNVNATP